MTRTLIGRIGWVLLFVGAGFLGRATIVDGHALSLVWPAAGVAVVWFLTARTRIELAGDVMLLGSATYAVNRVTGSDLDMALVFVVANLVQVLVVIGLIRRWSPETLPASGVHPLQTTRSLQQFLSAAAAGCLLAVALGSTGMYVVTGFFSVDASLTWWGRNVCGVLGIGSVGLLLLHRFDRRRTAPAEARVQPAHAGRGELVALLVVTSALFVVDYETADLPLAFLLPATTVWAGMRFPAIVVALHALGGGGAVVWLTLLGQGPFVAVDSVQGAALVAQLFVGMTVMLGLFLAAARQENAALLTDLQASQHELARQARTLAITIASMHDGIVVVDADGQVVLLNPAALAGLPPGDGLSGHHVTHLPLHGLDGRPLAAQDHPALRALAGEPSVVVDVCLAPDQPRRRIHTLTAIPLTAPGDGVTGALLVLRDVTLERDRQEELASFARVVAHDLLSPLTVISGWAESLRDTLHHSYEMPRELDMVNRIVHATDRMHDLISDLLANATSGEMELQPEPVDLADLARDVVASQEAALAVRIERLPTVLGDHALLRQLLDNLVGNALKYVADGQLPEVEISASTHPDGMATIRVADRGIGIPEGLHEEVFGEFHRAHPQAYPGTGLGLAICRRIAHRHNGTIRALPRPGGGTIFELTLPMALASVTTLGDQRTGAADVAG